MRDYSNFFDYSNNEDRSDTRSGGVRAPSTLLAQVRCQLSGLGRIVVCLFVGATLHAAPSVVALDSGEQLIGEILPQSTDATLVLKSALLGEITLPRERVLSIQPMNVETVAETPAPTQVAKLQPPVNPVIAEEAIIEERKIIDTLKDFKAPDDWSGNVRFGVNLSKGDRRWTETYARGQLEIDPKQNSNFYRFSGSYTYRETERADGTEFKSTDKYDAEFIYRRTFQENWFVQNALGYRADQVKGIDRELQESIGIGYSYKPSDRFEVLLGGGGGVEEFEAEFEDTRTGLNPLVNVFQEATWRPLERTSLVQKFNYYWNPEDSEQFNYVFSAAIRLRLTDLLGFEVSYNKSYDNDVGDGNVRDDTQWRNALVVYF